MSARHNKLGTMWQTEVRNLYDLLDAVDVPPAFLVGFSCWPYIMFDLLLILKDPFPHAGVSLLQEAEISFFTKGIVVRDAPRTRIGVTVRFGSLTLAETPLGQLRLMPMQAEAFTFHQQTYVFTSWCIAEEGCPCSWMELAPVKVEGGRKRSRRSPHRTRLGIGRLCRAG